jgi:hypothetical protein
MQIYHLFGSPIQGSVAVMQGEIAEITNPIHSTIFLSIFFDKKTTKGIGAI